MERKKKELLLFCGSISNQLVGSISYWADYSSKKGSSSANKTQNLIFYQNSILDQKQKPTLRLVFEIVLTFGRMPKSK